jgi:cell volume regulation protein A
MTLDVIGLLILFGTTVVIGYAGSAIFDRTKIPDIIWLILFGIIVGPLFSFVEREIFINISPFLAALALLIILFDAGLNLDFFKLLRNTPRSLLLSMANMAIAIPSVCLISIYLLGFDVLSGLLLGAMVGGTSSPVVIALINKLQIKEKVKTILMLESVLTDPLVIIISIALLNLIVPINQNYSPLQGLLGAFSIGAMLGLITGLVWLFILDKIKDRPFDHMLTLAIVFLLYALVESSGGSGPISAFTFGIVLGNGKKFCEMLKFRKIFTVSRVMKAFQDEITFFIKSFFFVYLGLIVVLNANFILYGVLISSVLIVARFVSVRLVSMKLSVENFEKNIMTMMGPRGLAAAVLAQLPLTYGLPNAEVFSNVVLIVIVVTVMYSTFMTWFFSRKNELENSNPKIK